MTPAQLVQAREESEECGGYFVVNGIEKIIRMLILAKRNYATALNRPSFVSKGPTYTPFAVSIRSTRSDQSSQTNVLHYLNDGNVVFRFTWRKTQYLVPVMTILKSLIDTNDREIFEGIIGSVGSDGFADRQFVMDRVEVLLRTHKHLELHHKTKARAYIGRKFRIVLGGPEHFTDEEAGGEFLRKNVLPHLGCYDVTEENDNDKFKMLLFMIRKLYTLAEGDCVADNPDAAQFQELLLGGFLYGNILKERIEEWLNSIRTQAVEWCRSRGWEKFTSQDFLKEFPTKIMRRSSENIGQALEYFLSTGNLVSPTGLDLQQASGLTVVAERINFLRFLSYFRAVHRGSFFMEQRTTLVRKLLPESWGFMCPVHTPDGSPCGLLIHLAHKCKVITHKADASAVARLLSQIGMTEMSSARLSDSVVVQLDGRVLGYCTPQEAYKISKSLRHWKVEGMHGIPLDLEIGYVPNSKGRQYPGIFLFSDPARMTRPVKYLANDKLDLVGPFEQPYMWIAVREDEIQSKDTTHVEFDPTNILSILANMTPFSDFNQSPRNMYQCQMGKQTMGTPGTALASRADNKTYRLQTGQTPIVRSPLHNAYGFDNFPNGTNAVVAVISYTGYDMDDAMIINKSAHERGLCYGTIYKTKKLDLEETGRRGNKVSKLWGFAPGDRRQSRWQEQLDKDGLPQVGMTVREGDVLAAWYTVIPDPSTGKYTNQDSITNFHRYKDSEPAIVESVRVLGSDTGSLPCQSVSITLRVPRAPVIGDKFSSRHGQKGVCSMLWPSRDLPFSETGISPDIIINPHAFPSRMTIGMFIESMAGKAGALHGTAASAAPFSFSEKDTAVRFFGEQLRAAGFSYVGSEPMYSGITGEELAADIFVGLVQYQRLRHMVSDKVQVRSTGPVTPLTGQPVKGRAQGGGIRVGEMERDALLAHGTAFLLQDRLLNCSDRTVTWLCRGCGGFLGTLPSVNAYGRTNYQYRTGTMAGAAGVNGSVVNGTLEQQLQQQQLQAYNRPALLRSAGGPTRCKTCATEATGFEPRTEIWEDGSGGRWVGGEDVVPVAVPGVLRYLDVELASMGVKMKFSV